MPLGEIPFPVDRVEPIQCCQSSGDVDPSLLLRLNAVLVLVLQSEMHPNAVQLSISLYTELKSTCLAPPHTKTHLTSESTQPFGLTSTPSYSLASIYCSVLSKCFLGLSSPLTFSVVLRLLWISSIKPLMYLVVTASFSWSK
jgi:hypothetical protein